jgi:hypothetical protein
MLRSPHPADCTCSSLWNCVAEELSIQCHHAPDRRMDGITVPGGTPWPSCVSFRHSRPRRHPLKGVGHTSIGHECAVVANAGARAKKANSACERFGGTLRRACLDLLIPFNERRLGLALKAWVARFNSARRPVSLGPEALSHLRAPQPDKVAA